MKNNYRSIVVLFLAGFISITTEAQTYILRQWPGYRGYMASGVLDNAGLPDIFDLQKMINIRWKTEIPGLGLSSPVIWGDKLFITTAVSNADKNGYKPGIYGDIDPVDDSSEHEWKVLCLDKNSGKLIWERTSCKGVPKMKRHPKSTHANTSVASFRLLAEIPLNDICMTAPSITEGAIFFRTQKFLISAGKK